MSDYNQDDQEPVDIDPTVPRCSRCEIRYSENTLIDESDGSTFEFCEQCFLEFGQFMQGSDITYDS